MKFPFIKAEKMALIDRLQAEQMGIGIMQMMEIAGLDVALVARKMCKGKKIAVLCGKGNNGGDGIVCARHLVNFGFECTLIFPFNSNKLKNVPKHQIGITRKMKIPIINYSTQQSRANKVLKKSGLIIDCLIGYNLNGNPRGGFAKLIDFANDSGKKILACDVPSGLDASTGKAYSPCMKADATISLTLPKIGLRKGKKYSGKIFVGYLSVPDSVLKKAKIKPKNWFSKNLVEKV